MSSEGIILLTPSVRVTIRDRNKLLVSEDRNGGGAGGGGVREGVCGLQLFKQVRRERGRFPLR